MVDLEIYVFVFHYANIYGIKLASVKLAHIDFALGNINIMNAVMICKSKNAHADIESAYKVVP